MMFNRLIRAASVLLMAASVLMSLPAAAASKETVRPVVGKPLQEAQKLIQAKKFKEALEVIKKADAAGGITPYESFVIEQMRGSAAAGAGDYVIALKSFEIVLAAGRLSPEDQIRISEGVINLYYKNKDYAKVSDAIAKYRAAGGKNPQILSLSAQAYYLKGDYAGAAKEISSQISEAEAAGHAPAQDQIKILASCALKQNNMALYTTALEKLVKYYPTPDYWADLIQRTARKPGFADKLALDMYRLLRATGNLKTTSDYSEMAQLAVQSQVPGEAKIVAGEGYSKKVLGSGPEADRHARLVKLIDTKIADDKKSIAGTETAANSAPSGDPLVNIGMAYVTYGDTAKGLPMIEQGIKKGNLKTPDQAKLHLGYAYTLAGQKDKALQTFKTVGGKDGSADLARLWAILVAKP